MRPDRHRRILSAAPEDALSKIKDGVSRSGIVWATWAGRTKRNASGIAAVKAIASPRPTVPCLPFPAKPSSTIIRPSIAVRWWGSAAPPRRRPVVCIQLEADQRKIDKEALTRELKELAASHMLTERIDTFLFHPSFPVDIRHNAKIFREKLAEWAQKKLE